MNILVVDIGNTSTSAGLYANGAVRRVKRLETRRSSAPRILALVREIAGTRTLDGAMIASVVPGVNRPWAAALRGVVRGPVGFVGHRLELGVALRYPKPESIGADRLANACGGVDRYGAPLIVADFGTAVTFDVVTKRGYEGGIIAPGLPLVFDYLAEKTAKLPHVHAVSARGAWGRSTVQAMQLGARWGYPGLVRAILAELKQAPALRNARVVVTGGHGRLISDALGKSAVVDPTLTLYGVGRIFELNHGTNA
ncbi:MAG TPA: type III pantothenate kinase [Kiritimatiellia bacterium]|nr:type III pantothenate kinase [Kiritimatiellia bacterium]